MQILRSRKWTNYVTMRMCYHCHELVICYDKGCFHGSKYYFLRTLITPLHIPFRVDFLSSSAGADEIEALARAGSSPNSLPKFIISAGPLSSNEFSAPDESIKSLPLRSRTRA
mmetsp:Transcript_11118/g.16647  ORF Transcript_11118/g.16647 Transcript_11118/m.16647 type:complete len:113 (+) Transcript_11118:87-425(+)